MEFLATQILNKSFFHCKENKECHLWTPPKNSNNCAFMIEPQNITSVIEASQEHLIKSQAALCNALDKQSIPYPYRITENWFVFRVYSNMYHLYKKFISLACPPFAWLRLSVLLQMPLKALKYPPSQTVVHLFVTLHLGSQIPHILFRQTLAYKKLQVFLNVMPNDTFCLQWGRKISNQNSKAFPWYVILFFKDWLSLFPVNVLFL